MSGVFLRYKRVLVYTKIVNEMNIAMVAVKQKVTIALSMLDSFIRKLIYNPSVIGLFISWVLSYCVPSIHGKGLMED